MYQWLGTAIDHVIAQTRPIPGQSTPRAYCPLCGEGAQSLVIGYDGYALPDGLRRHLGGMGNARSCRVMDVVRTLARDSLGRRERSRLETARAR
jgi:hypothetical protein